MNETNQSMQNERVEEVIRAFHMMWDTFPHAVLLLKKDRTILATNLRGAETGFAPGKKCYELGGEKSIHQVCRADEALGEKIAKRSSGLYRGRYLDNYWLPIPGEDGIYLHFGVDITKYVKPDLLVGSS